eukprot:492022-Hanusia_phi.AAC.1
MLVAKVCHGSRGVSLTVCVALAQGMKQRADGPRGGGDDGFALLAAVSKVSHRSCRVALQLLLVLLEGCEEDGDSARGLGDLELVGRREGEVCEGADCMLPALPRAAAGHVDERRETSLRVSEVLAVAPAVVEEVSKRTHC